MIEWLNDEAEAFGRAAETDKLVLADFWSPT